LLGEDFHIDAADSALCAEAQQKAGARAKHRCARIGKSLGANEYFHE